ncbi:MAG TPA: hypothetical protein VFE72_11470 [Lysobacter sp.]|nr:hypothetical protein [Lysobacter sp.]
MVGFVVQHVVDEIHRRAMHGHHDVGPHADHHRLVRRAPAFVPVHRMHVQVFPVPGDREPQRRAAGGVEPRGIGAEVGERLQAAVGDDVDPEQPVIRHRAGGGDRRWVDLAARPVALEHQRTHVAAAVGRGRWRRRAFVAFGHGDILLAKRPKLHGRHD